MRIIDWLDTAITVDRDGSNEETTILSYFAELLTVNGGKMTLQGFNKVREGGLYGRFGLTLAEAFAFQGLVGIVQGFFLADESIDGIAQQCFKIKIQNEINRVKAEGGKQRDITIHTEAELKELNKLSGKIK